MYNYKDIENALTFLSDNNMTKEYSAISDYIHDMEQKIDQLLKEKENKNK